MGNWRKPGLPLLKPYWEFHYKLKEADQPGGYIGPLGDFAHGRTGKTALGHTFKRRGDQILAALVLALTAKGFACSRLCVHCRKTGRVRQVGPPSQAMHSASASKVVTVQPAASMAALVFSKPATAMTS